MESHTHGQDAGANTTVVGDLIWICRTVCGREQQAFPDLPDYCQSWNGWLSKLRGILESACVLRHYGGGTDGIRRDDFVHEGQRNKEERKIKILTFDFSGYNILC